MRDAIGIVDLVGVAVSALVGAEASCYAEDVGLLGLALCFGFGLCLLGCEQLRQCGWRQRCGDGRRHLVFRVQVLVVIEKPM